jgi:hypothetical protein
VRMNVILATSFPVLSVASPSAMPSLASPPGYFARVLM